MYSRGGIGSTYLKEDHGVFNTVVLTSSNLRTVSVVLFRDSMDVLVSHTSGKTRGPGVPSEDSTRRSTSLINF